MDLYVVDFETYYDREYSLSKMTTEEYVRDPRFEVIGVAIKKDACRTRWFSGTMEEIGAAFKAVDWSRAAILSHNTMFDGAILSWHFGVRPKVWLDTLSMARAVHGPNASASLWALARRYGLEDKGDEVKNALGKRRSDFTPKELAAYGEYCKHDADLCYQIFHRLLGAVEGGFPRDELRLIDLTIRMFTEPTLRLNVPKLQEHLEHVLRAKEALLERAGGVERAQLMSNDKFADMLIQLGVDPPRKISRTTGRETWAFAKTDDAFVALQEHENPDVQALVSARLGTKTTLEETRTRRFIEIGQRGLLPIPLKYYAAHTGRWGGSESVNLQNLPSRGKDRKQLKSAIEPRPGYVILNSDSSQIEARVLAWLAEQDDLVEVFRSRGDAYKRMASEIYGVPVDEVTPEQRSIGKETVLGCGYNMGAERFQATLRLRGVEMPLEECARIVGVYREVNSRITALWRHAGECIARMSRGDAFTLGRNGVIRSGERNSLILPNGLPLRYPGLVGTQVDGRWEFAYNAGRDKKPKFVRIYGGKLVENVTQALARVIIGAQMLRISKYYRPALTVHDSIVLTVPEAEADAAAAYVEECMTWTPEWAEGLPVACECKVGPDYGAV